MNQDFFRPRAPVARALYDALTQETALRDQRTFDQWHQAEMEAVFKEAHRQAEKLGLHPPDWETVVQADIQAAGHVDYAKKFAYRVSEAMEFPRESDHPDNESDTESAPR